MSRPPKQDGQPHARIVGDLSPLWHEVARRARQKWQARGCPPSGELEDWLQAEDELRHDLASLLLTADLAPPEQFLADRDRLERLRAVEHSIARILTGSATLPDAAPRILGVTCEGLRWDIGLLWAVDREASVLRCVEIWTAPGLGLAEFVATCLRTCFLQGCGLPGRVWEQDAPLWVDDPSPVDDCAVIQSAMRSGLLSAAAFPIRNGTEFLGVMAFFDREVRSPDYELQATMASIGSQISVFIERREAEARLRRVEEESRIARQVQQGLLPRGAPAMPGFSLCGRCWPAQAVGGDCFDFVPMEADCAQCLTAVVADASGHGIAAALLISEARAYLRALAQTCSELSEILTLTNRRLSESQLGDHFVTLLAVRFDPRKRALVFAGAGHCPGYVIDSWGRVKAVLRSGSLPLGVDVGEVIAVGADITLAPGDVVFLYTDGITEAASPEGEFFGTERALDVVRNQCARTAEEVVASLCQAVQDFTRGQPQHDDMTAVVVKVEATPPVTVSCSSEGDCEIETPGCTSG